MNWLHAQWFGYWWSSDKGNGPENIQWTLLAIAVTALLVPFVRHWIENHFSRLHAKLDHVIENHPDIPAYIEPEFLKWEHWVVTLCKRFVRFVRRDKEEPS